MAVKVKTILGKISWQRINKKLLPLRLNREFKDLHRTYEVGDDNLYCGLSSGRCHRRIYCRHEEPIGSQIIHIWRHSDGICIRPAWSVSSDISLMDEVYEKLRIGNGSKAT